jgi:dihydrodipicolinate reductase
MRALITGSGNMGRAIASALETRGDEVAALAGRERGYPEAVAVGAVDVTFEFSHESTLIEHVDLGLAAGCRAFVIGTTGWTAADETGTALAARLDGAGARAVVVLSSPGLRFAFPRLHRANSGFACESPTATPATGRS